MNPRGPDGEGNKGSRGRQAAASTSGSQMSRPDSRMSWLSEHASTAPERIISSRPDEQKAVDSESHPTSHDTAAAMPSHTRLLPQSSAVSSSSSASIDDVAVFAPGAVPGAQNRISSHRLRASTPVHDISRKREIAEEVHAEHFEGDRKIKKMRGRQGAASNGKDAAQAERMMRL
ncbi:hypothetical protein CLAFUW4_10687 [Fulvia fulva]|uniref:Uncharacterized protein n=1 Tax=Passalora fulva TaxID=5499 RepID=A0A9Q8LG33_PASFU|nr:uncharacterized protein CLAFUR5_05301 [Fulvia fulva]KAK4615755.1 hypothetical protein CLAFUR4_10692 [Fulvia fulva]KAK4617185.1 hypothetical protein CLAFUR0_10551 [Fulvia fulva]UJO16735.1 hypothetical protein CLAFUR5_05301 [Fulvia fulva]WPV18716.1 hypothetical protein CLAFUW4_10687 [Fulvia fulva]WPV33880.1 hypothetical protein CLAFUW7_10689 [Fulvia fulva]